MAYAEETTVSVDRSIGEIRAMLRKAGAERLGNAETATEMGVACFLNGRMVRFTVKLPTIEEVEKRNGRGSLLSDTQRAAKLAQRWRQRARALQLVIKAKLESVESGVETFDEAFLANVVMPDGQTVAQAAIPRIEAAYITGRNDQALLPGY